MADTILYQLGKFPERKFIMIRLISSIILLFLFVPTLHAENADELSAIKKTALNYMDSWYKGNSKMMKQSLHKKLAKRSLK
jgi:hypothetical protein